MFVYETSSIINRNGDPFKVDIKITQEPVNEGWFKNKINNIIKKKKEKELNDVLNKTKKDMEELYKTPYGKAMLTRDVFMYVLSLYNPPFLDAITITYNKCTSNDKNYEYYNHGMVKIDGFYDKNNPKMTPELTRQTMDQVATDTIYYLLDNKYITTYKLLCPDDLSTYFIIVK